MQSGTAPSPGGGGDDPKEQDPHRYLNNGNGNPLPPNSNTIAHFLSMVVTRVPEIANFVADRLPDEESPTLCKIKQIFPNLVDAALGELRSIQERETQGADAQSTADLYTRVTNCIGFIHQHYKNYNSNIMAGGGPLQQPAVGLPGVAHGMMPQPLPMMPHYPVGFAHMNPWPGNCAPPPPHMLPMPPSIVIPPPLVVPIVHSRHPRASSPPPLSFWEGMIEELAEQKQSDDNCAANPALGRGLKTQRKEQEKKQDTGNQSQLTVDEDEQKLSSELGLNWNLGGSSSGQRFDEKTDNSFNVGGDDSSSPTSDINTVPPLPPLPALDICDKYGKDGQQKMLPEEATTPQQKVRPCATTAAPSSRAAVEDQPDMPAIDAPDRSSVSAPAPAAAAVAPPSSAPKESDDKHHTFLYALYDILSQPDKLTPSSIKYEDIITWLPHGKGFIISDKTKFEEEILPAFLPHTKCVSFIRRLKRWKFDRVSSGVELGAHYHPQFQRGKPYLIKLIKTDSLLKKDPNYQTSMQPMGTAEPSSRADVLNFPSILGQISNEKRKESKRRLGGSGSGVSGGTIGDTPPYSIDPSMNNNWGRPMAPCPPPPHHPMAPYPLPHSHYHTTAPYAHRPHPHHRMAPYPLPPHHMAPYTPIPPHPHNLHGHPFIPPQVQGMEYAAMPLQQAEQENEEQQDSLALLDENAECALNDDRTTYLFSTSTDGENLSDRQCYVRSHFIELFISTASDASERRCGPHKIHPNQIGLRCAYCVKLNPRDRTNRAVSYPTSIAKIYHTVADMQRFHFEKCKAVPPKVLQTYKSSKAHQKLGPRGVGNQIPVTEGQPAPKRYWESSAREIGLLDTNEGVQVDVTGGGMVRFEMQKKSVVTGQLERLGINGPQGQEEQGEGLNDRVLQGVEGAEAENEEQEDTTSDIAHYRLKQHPTATSVQLAEQGKKEGQNMDGSPSETEVTSNIPQPLLPHGSYADVAAVGEATHSSPSLRNEEFSSTHTAYFGGNRPDDQTTVQAGELKAVNEVTPLSKNPEARVEEVKNAQEANTKKRMRLGGEHEEAKAALDAWLQNNLEHPYPTPGEKRTFVEQTGLEMGQIEGWFKRARKKREDKGDS